MTAITGYLTATASEDWVLVLEVCERASASENNAKEAVRALRREFKYIQYYHYVIKTLMNPCRYGEPPAQLSAARVRYLVNNSLVI
jgi:hypothetical protein